MLEKQGITWRQALDGTTTGPLSRAWSVEAWPTVYILDGAGVIRAAGGGARGAMMARKVDELLRELETKGDR
jgi:hypothetical protein